MIEEGQRVRLKPFEGEPEQVGTVVAVEEILKPFGTDSFRLVQVDEIFRSGDNDDGIREVPLDQIEPL